MKPLQDGKKPLFSETEFNLIFNPVLPNILTVNRQLLSNLLPLEILKSESNKSEKNSEIVASSFLQIMPFFSMYSTYFSAYEKSIDYVKECRKSKPAFEKFLIACQDKPECKNLDLVSFLIKPIQV